MLKKYGFFILLVFIIAASIIIANDNIKTRRITDAAFFDEIENGITDNKGNLWVMYKDGNGYSVAKFSHKGKIDYLIGLQPEDSKNRIICDNIYVDDNENLYVTKTYVESSTGLIKNETVLKYGKDMKNPEEIFRINYTAEDNIWLPTVSHIATEGNNLFVVMNEVSNIKVYCVSVTSKQAVKTDEYIPEGDIYIDSAVRLDNGTVVFSTKDGIVYTIKNRQAVKIYPKNSHTPKLSKLQAAGNKVVFQDESTGYYVSMAYMDFKLDILLHPKDSVVSGETNINYSDTNKLFTGANGLVVAPVKHKGNLFVLYGNIKDFKGVNISSKVTGFKRLNLLIKVIVILAAVCLTVVIWQTYLFFNIKLINRRKETL